jgi:hypothetical protein
VAVWIEHEGAVVVRMVGRAQAAPPRRASELRLIVVELGPNWSIAGDHALLTVAGDAARASIAPAVDRHLIQNTPGYDPSCLVDEKYFNSYMECDMLVALEIDRGISHFLFMYSCEHLFIRG